MKITVDLNVILDVIQNRIPHYGASAEVLSRTRKGELTAVIPGHALTTIYYVVAKSSGSQKAHEAIDWLLKYFEISAVDKPTLQRARQLPLTGFEDAVVAAWAETSDAEYIVTRNVADFSGSPVRAITPSDCLKLATH